MSSPSHSASVAIEKLRTLALVGPSAAGKTSLAEALLHRAGVIGAPGSLERGSTVSDHDPLERRMMHSLNSTVMHLEHGDTRLHFIDTPGGPDFLGQSLPALEAVETAAIVTTDANRELRAVLAEVPAQHEAAAVATFEAVRAMFSGCEVVIRVPEVTRG